MLLDPAKTNDPVKAPYSLTGTGHCNAQGDAILFLRYGEFLVAQIPE
jgi:hypothetical protein